MIETTYEIDTKSHIVIVRRKGAFVAGDFFASILWSLNLDGYEPGMNLLVDAREMDYSKADETKIAAHKNDWSAIDGLLNGTRIAVVHSEGHNVTVSQKSTQIFQLDGIERRTFTNFDEAKAWAARISA